MSHVDEGLIHAWLDDEVSAAEAQTVEEHLETCPSCQHMLDEAARTRVLARELTAGLADSSVPDWQEIVARAAEPGERSSGASPPPPRGLLAAALAWAATLVFAFSLGWEARMLRGPVEQPRSVVAASKPDVDSPEPEPRARVDRKSLQPAPVPESQAATPERRNGTPEPRAPTPQQRSATPGVGDAMPGEPVRGAVSPQVASPEIGRASARRGQRAAAVAGVAEREEQLQPAPETAGLRKMVAGQFLAADAIERAQLLSAEQVALGNEVPRVQLTGAVLESAEIVDSGMQPPEEVGPGMLRVVYQDPQTGARVTLMQRLVDLSERAAIAADLGTSPATATLTVPANGLPSLRWLTPAGVLLTLQADLDEADLRRLALRVR